MPPNPESLSLPEWRLVADLVPKCLVVKGFRMEPPIGIEPMTYALRVRRSNRLS
jgi:hypothetical protein